jgi:hypothetical protein
MRNILISGGDSFVFGDNLDDVCIELKKDKASQKTWPSLLSKKYDYEYVCSAISGNSNMGISRNVMNCVEKYKKENLFVVVSWTFINRFEYRFSIDPFKNGFETNGSKRWYNFNSIDLYSKDKNHTQYVKKDILKFLEEFYRYVGHDDVYEYYSTLKEIVFLQNYLKENKIKFLFTTSYNFFRKSVDDESVNTLFNNIDWDNWYFFPPLQGFYEWAKINDYEFGDEHPKEDAHKDAFNLIDTFIHENNNKFNL